MQSTPVQHVGALHGSTVGLDGGGEEKRRIQTSTSVKQSVSTPADVSAVEPGARRILLDTPKTDVCSACSEDDVAPGDAEVLRPTPANPLSRMTGYVVATVMAILTLVALAGSISCVAFAVSVSKAVGITSSMVLHASGVRNISTTGYLGETGLPSTSDVRGWICADPALPLT